jgi:cytochrome c nitrite reductase small subunit
MSNARQKVRARLRVELLALAVLVGSALGAGATTFTYADGFSYFSKDAASCANCHLMHAYVDTHAKSSHAHVADCISCHMPSALLSGLIAKADNGARHAFAFTFGTFDDPLRIIPRNARILERACRECHTVVAESMLTHTNGESARCVQCHADVGHTSPPRP